jgi:hypothetical protein
MTKATKTAKAKALSQPGHVIKISDDPKYQDHP